MKLKLISSFIQMFKNPYVIFLFFILAIFNNYILSSAILEYSKILFYIFFVVKYVLAIIIITLAINKILNKDKGFNNTALQGFPKILGFSIFSAIIFTIPLLLYLVNIYLAFIFEIIAIIITLKYITLVFYLPNFNLKEAIEKANQNVNLLSLFLNFIVFVILKYLLYLGIFFLSAILNVYIVTFIYILVNTFLSTWIFYLIYQYY